MIFLHKKKIDHVEIDEENPDIYIMVRSPKQSTSLIDSKLWFTKNCAIIGERSGERWNEVEYFKIDEMDANYIKDAIDYKAREYF
jgi:hypothetical protein